MENKKKGNFKVFLKKTLKRGAIIMFSMLLMVRL